MAISDAVAGNLTTIYLAVIAVMKAYGLLSGRSFTGVFVLAASTAVVAAVLVATLTWDVTRKATQALSRDSHVSPVPAKEVVYRCQGGICWHGVAVKSPASQVWFRLPQHHPFVPPL